MSVLARFGSVIGAAAKLSAFLNSEALAQGYLCVFGRRIHIGTPSVPT